MAVPASARLLRIVDVTKDHVGEKVRVYGILSTSADKTSTIALLHSGSASILIDFALCVDAFNPPNFIRESKSVVMAMGSLEENPVSMHSCVYGGY